jgi:hypothetical protein
MLHKTCGHAVGEHANFYIIIKFTTLYEQWCITFWRYGVHSQMSNCELLVYEVTRK